MDLLAPKSPSNRQWPVCLRVHPRPQDANTQSLMHQCTIHRPRHLHSPSLIFSVSFLFCISSIWGPVSTLRSRSRCTFEPLLAAPTSLPGARSLKPHLRLTCINLSCREPSKLHHDDRSFFHHIRRLNAITVNELNSKLHRGSQSLCRAVTMQCAMWSVILPPTPRATAAIRGLRLEAVQVI